MKKQFFVLGCLTYLTQAMAQTVIPQTIPCITITQSNVVGLGSGIEATDCIDTDGNLTFLQYENYSIKAGEYISLGQNTSINPDASHQFHAYIDNGGMEIAWYYPNETPGTVGQFEKLELGVEFRDDIDQLVQNFTAETQVSPNLNPFNPEQVNLYAEFWWYSDGSNPFIPVGWYGPQLINGFYYEEYDRGATDWLKQTNQHDFRIRFAPRLLGTWRCKITAEVQGFGSFTASEFTFDCVESSSKDFMSVGENGRYFRIGDEPFFPVGHNVVWPQGSSADPWDRAFNPIVPPSFFISYHQQMSDIIANGGNYMRFINNPWSTDCEFEKLNDYSDRMRHSWELDKILEHADSIDLKIHFDFQIQYNFDVPDGFGVNHWDWSKYGDPFAGAPCNPADDAGYCYRSELDLENPIDFFTNVDAKKYYKYKLRYLIARYGYSNEIAVMELFSEINNAGSVHNMQLTTCYNNLGQPVPCCNNEGGPGTGKPYDLDPTVPPKIYEWQTEMCQYIKEELNHQNHPLAVSYGGSPAYDLFPAPTGDLSFASPYFDINTYNAYQVLIAKFEYNRNEVVSLTNTFEKPFMFSEYGWGAGDFQLCDNGNGFIKTLALSPFTGTAGAAMNWDWQSTDETSLWHHMGPVNQLMSGLKLDEENWQAMPPEVFNDNKVEMLHLRSEVDGNNQSKVVGAISNRTYNYYTQAPDSSVCKAPPLPLVAYQSETDFLSSDFGNSLELLNMGVNKQYHVEWFNALTGDFLLQQEYPSGLFGSLELSFPGTLTGNENSPILFFTVHPAGGSLKMSEEDTTETEKIEIVNLHVDTTIKDIKPTVWDNSPNLNNDLIVHISPNPASDILNISIEVNNIENYQWYFMSDKGDVLIEGTLIDKNFVVDLGSFESGAYYFVVENTQRKRLITKIVKI